MRLAVTGANGFVGRAVVRAARARGHDVTAVVRVPPPGLGEDIEVRAVGDLRAQEAQTQAVANCDVVIHVAGLIRGSRAALLEHNATLTCGLAGAAAKVGCKRFVLVSSLSVLGAISPPDQPLTDDAAPRWVSDYGESKYQAEIFLDSVSRDSRLSTIVLRPPSVFGPGAPSSPLSTLGQAVRRGLPLPVGGVCNQRSFIFSENLAEALVAAAEADAIGAFAVTDSAPISTEALVRKLADAVGVRPSIIPAPVSLLRFGAGLIGRGELVDRLLGSMAVDGTRFQSEVGWTPSHAFDDALRLTVTQES